LLRSLRLGFLTGDESKTMLDAHTQSGFIVGEPFGAPGVYDFGGNNSLTQRVSQLGTVMLRHRQTPPPEEAYSLHRKLSGAFLACIKLRARVRCRELFEETYARALLPGHDDDEQWIATHLEQRGTDIAGIVTNATPTKQSLIDHVLFPFAATSTTTTTTTTSSS